MSTTGWARLLRDLRALWKWGVLIAATLALGGATLGAAVTVATAFRLALAPPTLSAALWLLGLSVATLSAVVAYPLCVVVAADQAGALQTIAALGGRRWQGLAPALAGLGIWGAAALLAALLLCGPLAALLRSVVGGSLGLGGVPLPLPLLVPPLQVGAIAAALLSAGVPALLAAQPAAPPHPRAPHWHAPRIGQVTLDLGLRGGLAAPLGAWLGAGAMGMAGAIFIASLGLRRALGAANLAGPGVALLTIFGLLSAAAAVAGVIALAAALGRRGRHSADLAALHGLGAGLPALARISLAEALALGLAAYLAALLLSPLVSLGQATLARALLPALPAGPILSGPAALGWLPIVLALAAIAGLARFARIRHEFRRLG